MNWKSKAPYLAALSALIFAIGTLYLVANQIKKSFDAEIQRSAIETENISIAIEQGLLAQLAQVKFIQRLAAEKIDHLPSTDTNNPLVFDKISEQLQSFLKYSELISTIGIISEENTLLAAASVNNTNLTDFSLPKFQLNNASSTQIANDKKSLFFLQKTNNENNNIIFSEIDTRALAYSIHTVNKNTSIFLFDKNGTAISISSNNEKIEPSQQIIEQFIKAKTRSGFFNINSKGNNIPTHIREIGDTTLYISVSSNHSAHLDSWSRNAQIYVLTCLLIFALILQIIYFIWRSKRLNQSLILKENKLTASETRFRQMIEAMPIGLILARMPDYLIMYINQPAAQTLNLPQASALSKRALDFYLNSSDFSQQVNRLNKSKTSQNIECRLKRNDGESFWASISISLVQVADAQTLLIGVVDISERKKLEAELKQQATIDHLSGLFNRAHFIFSANAEIQRIQRNKKMLAY